MKYVYKEEKKERTSRHICRYDKPSSLKYLGTINDLPTTSIYAFAVISSSSFLPHSFLVSILLLCILNKK